MFTVDYTLNAPSQYNVRFRLPLDTCWNGAPSCFPSRRALPVCPLCVTLCLRFGFMLHNAEHQHSPSQLEVLSNFVYVLYLYVLVLYPFKKSVWPLSTYTLWNMCLSDSHDIDASSTNTRPPPFGQLHFRSIMCGKYVFQHKPHDTSRNLKPDSVR